MGMCYDIMFKAKVKNEEKAVKALRKFIDNRDADFNIVLSLNWVSVLKVLTTLVRIIFAHGRITTSTLRKKKAGSFTRTILTHRTAGSK